MRALLSKDVNFSVLTTEKNQNIVASLLTLKKVVQAGIHFNIPIYQRLYVWKINQIKTLLEDLKNAFLNNQELDYFLGGIMLSSSISGKIDLVDGQQRFTTLWLICDTLSIENETLKQFTYVGEEPRIHFSIRDKAQEYLKDSNSFRQFLKENGEIIDGVESEISEIIPLAEGRKIVADILKEFSKNEAFDVIEFGNYIFSKVILSQTFIPSNSDMNRVFEAMNNRGKQLEHHELLKSKLLEQISKEKRLTYSLIWDACSDMNSFIEKSIKDVADLNWKDLFSNFGFLQANGSENTDTKYRLDQLDIVKLLNNQNQQQDNRKNLLAILSEEQSTDNGVLSEEVKENEYSSKKIRSIIAFPTFLLHTLRVFHANLYGDGFNSIDVNDKKLIEHFQGDTFFSDDENDNEKNVVEFIRLLWDLRILFDRYVIKWVYNDELKEEVHSIDKLQISKNNRFNKDGTSSETISIQRIESTDEKIKDLVALQGMLYHSQEMITQYWLTPFLDFLSKQKFKSEDDILNELEILEHELFYSTYSDKLKDRTYNVIFKDKAAYFKNTLDTRGYLEKSYGTSYPNYIFYKLEYVLWKNKTSLCQKHSLNIAKWDEYRMTAKNSVEHIFPQNSKEENKHIEYVDAKTFENLVEKEINPLDEFGNLVLISPGMNSEYSNKPYQEKKGKFDSKKDIDSLKSALIFKHEKWDYKLAINHREEMIDIIEEYSKRLKSHLEN